MKSDHCLLSLFEPDLFGKPVPTFPDHALIGRSAGQFPEIVDPWCRRPAPDLPPRLEPVALADTAPANSPIVGADSNDEADPRKKKRRPEGAVQSFRDQKP